LSAALRYRPTPISLDANGPHSRTFHDTRQHLPGRAPLEASDYAGFERHALFHDLYLSADGRAIEAVGPPLVNLAGEILPVTLTVPADEGRGLRHRMRHYDRLTVHRFALPRALHGHDSLDVHVTFAHGQREERALRRVALAPVTLQVTTLQKDNPLEWIVDWLDWLGLLGVERVLLYDNGSRNADALFAALSRSADARPSLVFIDWPYAYGPVRSYYNQFAQATQNNHAHRCLGRAEWTGHFDVDEFPLIASRPPVANALRRRVDAAGGRTGLLRLDSFWVPDVRDAASDVRPTVRDFDHREREARGRAHKYLVRGRALRMANTHNARLRPGWTWRTPSVTDACFLHYKPLTTRWRDYAARGERERFDPALHVTERAVIDALAARSSTTCPSGADSGRA